MRIRSGAESSSLGSHPADAGQAELHPTTASCGKSLENSSQDLFTLPCSAHIQAEGLGGG